MWRDAEWRGSSKEMSVQFNNEPRWGLRRSGIGLLCSVDSRPVGAAVLVLPAALPVLWFEFTKNHSQVHSFFVYWTIAVIVGILFAAAVVAITGCGWVGPSDRLNHRAIICEAG